MIFKLWKTICLEVAIPEQIEEALTSIDVKVSDTALDVLRALTPHPDRRDIPLVKVPVSQLHPTRAAPSYAIYERAVELGLHLVPATVGPYLRCDYRLQPPCERLLLGMKPVFCFGYPYILALTATGDGLCLQTESGNLGHIWNEPDDYWIFGLSA